MELTIVVLLTLRRTRSESSFSEARAKRTSTSAVTTWKRRRATNTVKGTVTVSPISK